MVVDKKKIYYEINDSLECGPWNFEHSLVHFTYALCASLSHERSAPDEKKKNKINKTELGGTEFTDMHRRSYPLGTSLKKIYVNDLKKKLWKMLKKILENFGKTIFFFEKKFQIIWNV